MDFGFARFRARLALGWEVFARAWWPLALLGLLLLPVLLSGLLPALGWLLHSLMLLLAALLLVGALWWGFRRQRPIDQRAVLRRLERDNALVHQPLQTLADRAVLGDGQLWRQHLARSRAALGRLRVAWPDARIREDDPRGLRWWAAALGLVLLIATSSQWGSSRLLASLSPQWPHPPAPPETLVDAWVSPPAYTGLPPFLVPVTIDPAPRNPQTAEVALAAPLRSQLLVQVQGGAFAPGLAVDGEPTAFSRASAGAFRHEVAIDRQRRVDIRQRADRPTSPTLAALDVAALPDAAPEVALLVPPRTTEAGSLRLQLAASDDYGLSQLALLVSAAEPSAPRNPLIDAWLRRELLSRPGQRLVELTEFFDMTPHPFAGQPVSVRLEAADDIDQRTRTEPTTLTLPTRSFTHPVARQLVALRQQLFQRPDRPAAIAPVLAALASDPSAYQNRSGIAAALGDVERLLNDPALETAGKLKVIDSLWDIARAIDDDPIRRAEERLRQLEEQLRDALARGASDEELLALMDELREAMKAYQDAVLAKKLAEMLESGELNIAPPDQQAANPFEDLTQQLEDAARNGAREEAERLLDQLREMLENLENAELQLQMGQGGQPGQGMPGAGQGAGGGSGGSGQSQAMEMMNQLGEIMRQQQQQLNRSFQRQQGQNGGQAGQPGASPSDGFGQQSEGQQGQNPGGENPGGQSPSDQNPGGNGRGDSEGALEQEATRRALGDFMRSLAQQLGEIPQGLAEAERDMRGAVGSLRGGDSGSAVADQSSALNNLQRGAQEMARLLDQQAQNQSDGESGDSGSPGSPGPEGQPGQQPGGGQQEGWVPDGGVDPLGRAYSEGNSTAVPDGALAGSARAIRDELRRRAANPDLGQTERDYLNDLLTEFE